jgi:hypothetical protein
VTISLETQTARPATLTTSELDSLLRLWRLAGLPATTGYGTTILAMAVAMAVASNQALAAALTSVDTASVRGQR